MTRTRVIHVITRLIVGGAQEAAVLACAHVDRGEFDSTLVIGPETGREGSLRELAESLDVRVHVVAPLVREVAPARDVRAARSLNRLFRELQPDVVHTHSSKAGVLGRWAARHAGVPAVVHTVHGWSFHDHMPAAVRQAYVWLERRAARWCDRLVTVSELDRAKGLAAGVGTNEQYETIHEINDLRPYFANAEGRSEARARLGLPEDAAVVGTVGRLTTQKDPRTWVRSAARIAAEHRGARFVMIGDGPLGPAVERLARKLGIADRLMLTGVRHDVPAVLPALDVFLLTSRWEGLPLVIPQAMAAGVPVVASTADGNREVVRHEENGLLAPPERAQPMAEGVVRVLTDAGLRRRVVVAGRETAAQFSLDRTVPRLEALYDECSRGVAVSVSGTGPSRDR